MVSFQRVKKNKNNPTQRKQKKAKRSQSFSPTYPNHVSEQDNILDLQGKIGNQAVLQLMREGVLEAPKAQAIPINQTKKRIQRMPSADEARSGIPDSDAKDMAERKLVVVNMVKDFHSTIDKYAENFPKTADEVRQKGEAYYQKTSNHLLSLFDGIFSTLKVMKNYFEGRKGKKHSQKGKQKHQQRVKQLQKFARKMEQRTQVKSLLSEVHHQLMMAAMTGEGGIQNFTAQNIVGDITDNAKQGGIHSLGKGQLDTNGRGVKTGYFKADEAKPDDAGIGLEIKNHEGKQSLRAVATYRISELMELGIIPYTALTRGEDEKGNVTTGQFMEEAEGVTGRGSIVSDELNPQDTEEVKRLLQQLKDPNTSEKNKRGIQDEINNIVGVLGHKEIDGKIYKLEHAAADIDWMTPVIQKDLSTLQLFDIIVGHADRHAENFIVETDLKGVKGIDNDSVWGQRVGKKMMENEGDFGYKKAMKTPGLPPVVDAEVALRVVSTSWKSIAEILDQYTMRRQEIEAAKGRWEYVQERIKAMIMQNKLATMGMDEGEQVFLYMQLYDAIGEALPPDLLQKRLKVWGMETEEDMKDNSYIGNINSHYKSKANPEEFV